MSRCMLLIALTALAGTYCPSVYGQAVSFSEQTAPFVEDEYTFYLLHLDDDKEAVQDKSFTEFHGEVNWGPGKFGKACEFNGSQLVLVPAYGSWNAPKQGKKFQTLGKLFYGDSYGLRLKDGRFTVEMWVKVTPDAIKQAEQTIISFGASYVLKLSKEGTIVIYAPLNWKGHAHILTGSIDVSDGKWHHIAAVTENNNSSVHQLRLYVDGRRDQGIDRTDNMQGLGFLVEAQNMPLTDHFICLGALGPHLEPFAGAIDELRVSFKARYK